MKIELKRVYEAPSPDDGVRVLVDRLWPRGLSREAAKIDFWSKETAPSTALRQWYRHDPKLWPEFKRRFFAELREHPEAVVALREHLSAGKVTFLFASREERLNNAAALREFLTK